MREITVITVLCLLTLCNVFAAGADMDASPARLFIEGGTLLDGTGTQPGETRGSWLKESVYTASARRQPMGMT